MSENALYNSFIDSKSGIKIPVFASGRTVESRYDPMREGERLAGQIKDDTNFIILLGIAGGTLINCICKSRPDIFILAVEKGQEDIDFLSELPVIKEIRQNKKVCLCHLKNLENQICQLYLPAFYGNLQVIEQRGWISENQESISFINQTITKALQTVSADFSVQSHFGKLWQHNILSNIILYKPFPSFYGKGLNDKRKAVIFAAGPSLDQTIKTIIDQRDNYFLIASDTAFSSLLAYNIIPDAVLSIDGQYISNCHFLHSRKADLSRTDFIFDLSANPSAVKKLMNEGLNVIFFKSGHPFCDYADQVLKLGLPSLYSGAGTVTISALDYALKCGFKDLMVLGADFSYINGKPYAKGTYLDTIYNYTSLRTSSSQKKYCGLEFRTQLIQKDKSVFSTNVLDSYKESFEKYLLDSGLEFRKEENMYKIKNSKAGTKEAINKDNSGRNSLISQTDIRQLLLPFTQMQDVNFSDFSMLTKKDISLLPLISWIRSHDNNNKAHFNYYYKKALNYFSKWL